jgi:hypothetical protein
MEVFLMKNKKMITILFLFLSALLCISITLLITFACTDNTSGDNGDTTTTTTATATATATPTPTATATPTATETAQPTINPSYLEMWLKFDETSGTIASDSSDNTYDGILMNDATWDTGIDNNAVSLDGADDYVDLSTDVADVTDFTFAAWIYWDGGDTWQEIFEFSRGVDGFNYFYLTPHNSSTTSRAWFTITTGGWGNEQRITVDKFPSGEWLHVAVTLGGDSGTLYMNGRIDGTADITINPSAIAATSASLGRTFHNNRPTTDPHFDGLIDDVRFYNQALTENEIAGIFWEVSDNPIISDETVTISGQSGTSLTLSWAAAKDDVTVAANLKYKVVRADTAEEIDTLAEADAITGAGNLLQDWTSNSTTIDITGLASSQDHYFTVLVKDAADNKAMYDVVNATVD